jgi:hypothetical protein
LVWLTRPGRNFLARKWICHAAPGIRGFAAAVVGDTPVYRGVERKTALTRPV